MDVKNSGDKIWKVKFRRLEVPILKLYAKRENAPPRVLARRATKYR
jgi:hypothetical protein